LLTNVQNYSNQSTKLSSKISLSVHNMTAMSESCGSSSASDDYSDSNGSLKSRFYLRVIVGSVELNFFL